MGGENKSVIVRLLGKYCVRLEGREEGAAWMVCWKVRIGFVGWQEEGGRERDKGDLIVWG